jgi:hypothetical protein
MRLLNTSTLQVEEFLQSEVPDYVILSHTWGSEEVTLQDILSNVAPSKKGFAKLVGCCKRAKDDGFTYCWIDTCCIDKTSSAELSEAINSMYQWYKGACICYAYLEDVQGNPQLDDYEAFSKSRWFTRGWTLQELIAPGIVEFYNVSWVDIGTRSSLQKRLTGITGINGKILTGGNPLNCPVAVRMSWAARRETSRVEDQAYCLLGIFGVNMALLYGEGHRAFLRLQEEILRIDEDYTLFAWDVNSSTGSLLASSPWQFHTFMPRSDLLFDELKDPTQLHDRNNLSRTPFSLLPPPHDSRPPQVTSRGIHVTLPILHYQENTWHGFIAVMRIVPNQTYLLCVRLSQIGNGDNRYEKIYRHQGSLVLLPKNVLDEFRYSSIYVNPFVAHFDEAFPANRGNWDPPIVRVDLDPALLSEITCIGSNMINLRSVYEQEPESEQSNTTAAFQGISLTEFDVVPVRQQNLLDKLRTLSKVLCIDRGEARTTTTGPPHVYYGSASWSGACSFRFHFSQSVSLDLDFPYGLEDEPCFIAGLKMTGERGSIAYTLGGLDISNGSDRATLQVRDATTGGDRGLRIRIAMRRVAALPIAPNSRRFVLILTEEPMMK